MADRNQIFHLQELPGHLIMEVLTSGRLGAADLARVELTCRTFGTRHEFLPEKFNSVAEYAAYCACHAHNVFAFMSLSARGVLFGRCGGNWKKVLRFLQSIEQSSSIVDTTNGKMQVDTGKYHTLLIHNSSLYSCGSNLCGVLGHGHHKTQCATFSRINFPSLSPVIHVSASHNHAAFVTQSGEVFTCGDNSSFCCGHGDIGRTVFKPTRIEALRDIPCKQVATGLSFTVILTRNGEMYTCGNNTHGQLGQGDNAERLTPALVKELVGPTSRVAQVTAGPSYSFAVMDNGSVYSFGSCNNFCLGHGDQNDVFLPRVVKFFEERDIHVVRVSAGDEHVLAIDSSGYVYSWGRGYCGALGHGNQNDRSTPTLVTALKSQIVVQVCARKRKTFVLTDEGSVYAFGWMGFGSLGFSDRNISVIKPRMLDSLRGHSVSQISTGLYHTVAVTNKGVVFGFGDNERAQLGHEWLRGCLLPTEIVVESTHDGITVES